MRTASRGDAGESLLELLVAMAILGTTAVVILAGFSALSKTSGIQRDQGKALAALAGGSEYAKSRACAKACSAEASVPSSSVPHDSDTVVAVSAPGSVTLVSGQPALTSYTVTVTVGSATFTNSVVLR